MAPLDHLGLPFSYLGSTLGSYFGISGAPWEAILASWDHPGGPWEQQDGHEVVHDRILVDFGVMSGGGSKCFKICFICSVFPGHILTDF